MAEKNIVIARQNYKKAGEMTDQFNGYEPNLGEAVALTAETNGSTSVAALAQNDIGVIPAYMDFKDHKTVFYANSTNGATLTFQAGDTYGARAVDVTVPAGVSMFWIDSTKFADKRTGAIKFKASAAVTVIGYEMR